MFMKCCRYFKSAFAYTGPGSEGLIVAPHLEVSVLPLASPSLGSLKTKWRLRFNDKSEKEIKKTYIWNDFKINLLSQLLAWQFLWLVKSNAISHVFQHNRTELSLIERLLGIVREDMLADGLGFFFFFFLIHDLPILRRDFKVVIYFLV